MAIDTRIRVLLADDNVLVRGGIAGLLAAAPDLEVAAQADTAERALRLAEVLAPDVVVLEPDLLGPDPVGMTRAFTAVGARVALLTDHRAGAASYAALRAGATGFLIKRTAPDVLVSAVRAIAAGEAWLESGIAGELLREFVSYPIAALAHGAAVDRLTHREREVLTLIAQGCTNQQVAGALHVAECTVKTHLGRILTKLALRDRTQAVVLAYRSGLVRVP
jgi:DNA-binding NarL/FixJ family response regulator